MPRSSALTWSGFSVGRCDSSSATPPDTTAADCDVPLPFWNREPTSDVGFSTTAEEPGAAVLTIDWPGATRSGLRTPSPVLDHAGTTSSATSWVSRPSTPPTASTKGSLAGLFSAGVP